MTAARVGRLGGITALVITTVLAILVLDEPIVLFFLLPATAGGLAGTVWGQSTPILILSGMLVIATAFMFLSIGVGLIYIPAIIFLIIGAAMNLKPPKEKADEIVESG